MSTACTVLQPSNTLTASTAQSLLREINECLQAKTKTILIDCQDLAFIDSSGLGILVSLHAKLKLAGGKLYLCSLNEQARCLFDITDMDRIFEIFPDRDAFLSNVVNRNLAVLIQ